MVSNLNKALKNLECFESLSSIGSNFINTYYWMNMHDLIINPIFQDQTYEIFLYSFV